jgi:hypothetical protein
MPSVSEFDIYCILIHIKDTDRQGKLGFNWMIRWDLRNQMCEMIFLGEEEKQHCIRAKFNGEARRVQAQGEAMDFHAELLPNAVLFWAYPVFDIGGSLHLDRAGCMLAAVELVAIVELNCGRRERPYGPQEPQEP